MKVYLQATTGKIHSRRSCGMTSRTRYDHQALELSPEQLKAREHLKCQRCWA